MRGQRGEKGRGRSCLFAGSGRPGCGREGLLPRRPPGLARPFPASKDGLGDTGPRPTPQAWFGRGNQGRMPPLHSPFAAADLGSDAPTGVRGLLTSLPEPSLLPWEGGQCQHSPQGGGTHLPGLSAQVQFPGINALRSGHVWHVTHRACSCHLSFQDTCIPTGRTAQALPLPWGPPVPPPSPRARLQWGPLTGAFRVWFLSRAQGQDSVRHSLIHSFLPSPLIHLVICAEGSDSACPQRVTCPQNGPDCPCRLGHLEMRRRGGGSGTH